MGKKKHKGLLHGLAAKAIHNPVVQKALADIAVATVLAIAAKLSESRTLGRLSGKAGRKIEEAAGVSKSARARKPGTSQRRTA